MIRQYGAQRCCGGDNPLRIGPIPIGAIFYLQDDTWWRDRYRGRPICREPWIVEGFLNGVMAAARRSSEDGRWLDLYISGRSDMALIRSLRSNRRRRRILVRSLILHEEEGLRADDGTYPTLVTPAA